MDEAQPDTPAAPEDWGGEPLRSTLRFLAVPGAILGMVVVFGISLPPLVLYGLGGIIGLALVARTMRDPEWLLAVATIYLPLNKLFVVPIGMGLNGTNILLGLLVFSWFRHGSTEAPEAPDAPRPPASSLVAGYAAVTLLSVVTALVTAGADYVFDHALDIKWWLDQFIVFFTFLRLIRDGKTARRVVVYMMISAAVVLMLGAQEWVEKRGASSIEKARLLGPQIQPNDFGAFLAYAAAPFVALLLNNLRRLRILAVAVPFLILTARILLATFSRGAYLGVALAGVVAGYVRGKVFLIGAAVVGLLLIIAVPELVPKSLQARMGQTQTEAPGGERLDTSAQTRLILWDAAVKMTLHSPLFGYGFKTFPKFKDDFTETRVHESDNHNMYLYLSSQMGVPAVLLFLMILWRMSSLGIHVYRLSDDMFGRVAGMAAPVMAAAAFVVNMFGSRMVDICVSVNFWIMLAVVSRLWTEVERRRTAQEAS